MNPTRPTISPWKDSTSCRRVANSKSPYSAPPKRPPGRAARPHLPPCPDFTVGLVYPLVLKSASTEQETLPQGPVYSESSSTEYTVRAIDSTLANTITALIAHFYAANPRVQCNS